MNQAENSSLSLAAFDIYVLHIIATRPQILAHSWKSFQVVIEDVCIKFLEDIFWVTVVFG